VHCVATHGSRIGAGRLADRVYDPSDPDDPDSDVQRRFRRWVVSTTIDLRNL
jgi:hypothetical protein